MTLTASDPGAVDLPADLLSDKRAERIYLNCPPLASPKVNLTIDSNAFEYSRINTTHFEINNCDLLAQSDMSFLDDFTILNTLKIQNSLNVEAFESLPTTTLPGLKEIAITGCTGLENIAVTFPDLTPARLERLYLNNNGLIDAQVNNILISVGSSSSVSSLQELNLASNSLSKVARIASFSKLTSYNLNGNNIPFMSLSALIFGSPVTFVGLNGVAMTAIEGGAFQGMCR